MRKALIAIFFLCGATALQAQDLGVVKGTLVDADTGEEIIGGNVVIQGTTTGASSDVFGNFEFAAPAGTHNLVVSYIGYQTVVIEAVEVGAGEATVLDLSITEDSEVLDDVVVVAKADQTSEIALIQVRRESVDMKQFVSAQELNRKGISDVEGAVTQVTGVSKQAGVKNVFVRGLGDRYNTTTLNGLPLPSEDPEYKNIDLGFFPTNVIGNVAVNKTFTVRNGGNVGGANIDISSREIFEDKEFQVRAAAGVNSVTVGEDFIQRDVYSYLGYQSLENPIDRDNITSYDFEGNINPTVRPSPPVNTSFGAQGGLIRPLGGGTFDVFAVANLTNDLQYTEGEENVRTPNGGRRRELSRLSYEAETSILGMLNLGYNFGRNHRIAYVGTYIQNNRHTYRDYFGFNNGVNDSGLPQDEESVVIRQQSFVNALYINQILTEWELSDRLQLEVKGSFNLVRGGEPDRITERYRLDPDGQYYPVRNVGQETHRAFTILNEDDLTAWAALDYSLSDDIDNEQKISFGGSIRRKTRDFTFELYDHETPLPTPIDLDNPDGLFNQEEFLAGTFVLEPIGVGEVKYDAARTVATGFVETLLNPLPRLNILAGLRFDQLLQTLTFTTRQEINGEADDIEEQFWVPSVAVKYTISDDLALRLSGSYTYVMPQFKEAAPFLYDDVSFTSEGNPNIQPSRVFNLDLKNDWYLGQGELITVGVFYKYVADAISRQNRNDAGNLLSYFNLSNTDIYGAELEARKNIWSRGSDDGLDKLSFGLNVSLLFSDQTFIADPNLFSPNDPDSDLQGATPLLLNTDLSYNKQMGRSELQTALVLNYFVDRVFALGLNQSENIEEVGYPLLNFNSRYRFADHWQVSFRVNNILDPNITLQQILDPELATQTDDTVIIIDQYKRGTTFRIGIGYTL